MAAPVRGLTAADLTSIRDALAGGRKPKVVFTSAAGQMAGNAGSVVELTNPADSDEWIVVQFGRDQLPFSPADLAIPVRAASGSRSAASPGGRGTAGKADTRKRTSAATEPPGPPLLAPAPAPRKESVMAARTPADKATAAASLKGGANGHGATANGAGGTAAAASGAGRAQAAGAAGAAGNASPAGNGRPAANSAAGGGAGGNAAGGNSGTGANGTVAANGMAAGSGMAAGNGSLNGNGGVNPARPAKAAKPKVPASLVVTLSYAEKEWTIAATQGTRSLAKPYVIKPAEALRMVALIDVPGVHDAVENIIAAERAEAEHRAVRLREELAEIESRLAELSERG